MQTFLISAFAVAIAEFGDKSQLVALVLAAKYRKPWPIILGILVASLIGHTLAGLVGTLVSAWLDPTWMRWLLTVGFLGVAAWMLMPDKDDEDDLPAISSGGAFLTTVVAFFLLEMGDKTQLATVVLAATYDPLWQVVTGATLGMVLVNGPVVLLGSRFSPALPMHWIRRAAAALFAILGLWVAWHGVPG